MDSRLFVELEGAIQKWMDKAFEADRWPNTYAYEDQVGDMAKAAALVFDASVKGQKFMEREEG